MKLTDQKCSSCEGKKARLTREQFAPYLDQVPDWVVVESERKIVREWMFKSFKDAMAFASIVGDIAERENHHPDIHIHSWNRVKLVLYTHAIKGLSENDFIVAAHIDQIDSPRPLSDESY